MPGLWGCDPYTISVLDGCPELHNFILEVTLPSPSSNHRCLNTDILVTDGNRSKNGHFNINQEWNPHLLEGWSRTLLHTVECILSHLLISKSLSADTFPAASSCITLSRSIRKTRINCSNELTVLLSQLIVALLFTRGKMVSKNTSGCNFSLCYIAPRTIMLATQVHLWNTGS